MRTKSKNIFAFTFFAIVFEILAATTSLAQTLRQAADQIGLLTGAAVAPFHFSEPDYANTFAREYNMAEPESVMKWSATEPARGEFNFQAADAVVEFAQAHGMKVRGHNLLWHSYNPAWVAAGHFSPDELRDIMRQHITRVAAHYARQVFAWDVVNEAFADDGSVRHSIWYDQPGIGLAGKGTAYIEQAFRWARAADPAALLFYNDYDAEGMNAKSDAIYAMVKDFKARGVPIDGVGLQAHLGLNAKGVDSLAANMARLAELGVQLHITEFDVGIPIDQQGKPLDLGDLEKQAAIYRQVATACVQQPACTAFQTWGFTDKYSWIPGFTRGKRGFALPFDRDYQPVPAERALLEVFTEAAKK